VVSVWCPHGTAVQRSFKQFQSDLFWLGRSLGPEFCKSLFNLSTKSTLVGGLFGCSTRPNGRETVLDGVPLDDPLVLEAVQMVAGPESRLVRAGINSMFPLLIATTVAGRHWARESAGLQRTAALVRRGYSSRAHRGLAVSRDYPCKPSSDSNQLAGNRKRPINPSSNAVRQGA
jgi:hypothetical protein